MRLSYPLFPPFLVNKAQREHALPFHSLKRAMSYYPANVAGHDPSLLYTVSDPITGSFHSRDPFSAVARLSSEPPQPQPQPQLYTTRAEKPPDSSAIGYSPGAVSYAHREESAAKVHGSVVARVSWYRTRRGIIIITIVAIIILTIGATLGVILGGTRH